jgi:hypothetical protein
MAIEVRSVALPADAALPFEVYLNGAPLAQGADYYVEGRWLRLPRERVERKGRKKLGLGGRLLLTAGIGVYGDVRDTVDLRYTVDGKATVAAGLPVLPAPELGDSV